MPMNLFRLSAVILACGLVAACGGGGGSGSTSTSAPAAANTGTVTLTLSDAPIQDFRSVWMTIDEIRFLSNAGQDILVLEEPVHVDFLALQNFSEVLLRREVVAGTYSKIRLILSSLDVELQDGSLQSIPLNGLRKVDINPRGPFTVRAGQDLVIDLDVDLHKSIHVVKTGNRERFRFRPVIFAGVSSIGPFDKLFRIEGRVESIGTPAGMFRVCDIRRAFADDVNRPRPADVCVTVDPGDETPYFDAEVTPIETPADGLGQLLPNDHVVVYGQFDYDAGVPGDPLAGDPMIPAVIAVGQNFQSRKGQAHSEFRPSEGADVLGDFDLGAVSDVCAIDANPLLVEVQQGAPALEERPAMAQTDTTPASDPAVEPIDDLSAISLLCRNAEVEGLPDDPDLPTSIRAFIVLLGESPLEEFVGTLTERAGDPAGDYDMAVEDDPGVPDPAANDEVIFVSAATRIVALTSDGAGGTEVQDRTVVPVDPETVTVYGTRAGDGIEVSFILVDETDGGSI